MLLPEQFKWSILILGKNGTCEKYDLFQCNNGKCLYKRDTCDGSDDCGDNSDESKTDGPFCGMCTWFFCALDSFVPLIQIFSLLRLYSLIHAVKNMGLLGTALGRILCVVKQVWFLSDKLCKKIFKYNLQFKAISSTWSSSKNSSNIKSIKREESILQQKKLSILLFKSTRIVEISSYLEKSLRHLPIFSNFTKKKTDTDNIMHNFTRLHFIGSLVILQWN